MGSRRERLVRAVTANTAEVHVLLGARVVEAPAKGTHRSRPGGNDRDATRGTRETFVHLAAEVIARQIHGSALKWRAGQADRLSKLSSTDRGSALQPEGSSEALICCYSVRIKRAANFFVRSLATSSLFSKTDIASIWSRAFVLRT